MKAVRLESAGGPLRLEEVPIPVPRPDEVLVRIAGCGVCHTDIGFWRDGVPTRHALPLTLGHEVSGVVADAGSEFKPWVGREVIVPSVIPCGRCALCRMGRGNACRGQIMPGNDLDGGFAEWIVVPGRGLCAVLDRGGYDLSELSVVADAVTTPYQAVVRSGLLPGDLAVVIGAGGVGGYAVQIAAALGARVVAIDVDDARLGVIERHGASLTVNPSRQDFKTLKKEIAARAREWGCPADAWKIFECSGTTEGQQIAYGLLNYAGTMMVVGFTLGKLEIRLSNLMAFDATVQGTWGCRPELYPDALRLVTTGRVTLKPFIERFPLAQGPEVVRRVADHEIHRRAILEPNADGGLSPC
jgi:6-hydroxycyclohex-1-ene-1-carbonyl-CoA dehydrogenase